MVATRCVCVVAPSLPHPTPPSCLRHLNPPPPFLPATTQSDFDGHSKRSDNNLHVYSSVYGDRCVGIGAQFLPVAGFQEVYLNNTCIVGAASGVVYGLPFQDAFTHQDVANASEFQARFISGNNTIYMAGVPKGFGPFETFAAFTASGYEVAPSTIVSELPTADIIMQWGRALLMP